MQKPKFKSGFVSIIGRPNVGKSTIFNGLTGMRQHTGNWPGKTVATARGEFQVDGQKYELVDLPGTYSLAAHSEEEEIARVVPVIRAVKAAFDVPVSLDTYKSQVASAGIQAGADMINDVWGLKYEAGPEPGRDDDGTGRVKESAMARVIADSGLPCCLMHNKEKAEYENFYQDMLRETRQCVEIARAAGIASDKIILDPGIGFGKTYEMNLETLHYMERFHSLGYPMLLGTSRKSVIGLTLDLPADQREEGTLATTVIAVMKKYAFVRVHDVKANKRAIQMTKAILSAGPEES